MSDSISVKREKLHRQAEKILQNLPEDSRTFDTKQIQELLQDLHVYQIELELQNEELHSIQKELESTRARFKNLYQFAPIGYVVLNQSGIILQTNSTFAKMICRDASKLQGTAFAKYLAEEDEHIFRGRFKSFFRNPTGKSMEVQIITHESKSFYARLEASPQHKPNTAANDPDNYELLLTVSDISDRKKVEEDLFKQREYLYTTLKCIGDGVITTDVGGNIILMNNVAEQLTGWKALNAQGKPFLEVFSKWLEPDDKGNINNPIDKVIAKGEAIDFNTQPRLFSHDGTARILDISGAPIRNEKGVIIGVVLVVRDVTEKTRLIESMSRMDKLDSLGVLAGGIAHDFNNLLCGIFGYIEMARYSSKDEERVCTFLDKALSVYNRAKDLTNQFLTFAKGGAPIRKLCDIKQIIQKNSSFTLSGSHAKCEYSFDNGLLLCEVDENQIGQVINNIVLNAIQAMPNEGTITITAKNFVCDETSLLPIRPGNYIKISFTDTGSGISPEHIKHIFDPFFTTKQTGNGLGLSTCYSILQRHAGHIEVESIVGKGSTFHIYLPASGRRHIEFEADFTNLHKGNGLVLVMDDEQFMIEIAQDLFIRMGYTVLTALDGEEALEKIESSVSKSIPLSAIFLDLTVPGSKGGKEIIASVRNLLPNIPIFACSGYSEDPVMADPAHHGFTDKIQKPYRANDLSDLLNRYMN